MRALKNALNVRALDIGERIEVFEHRGRFAMNPLTGEVREIENPVAGENHRLLNHVLELADVTRPLVALECLERSGRDAIDLMRGCFPGGSITGAPKVRAMQIIEELEPHRRGIYCGSIGYIGYDGAMDSSIAIRTLVYRAGVLRFWAGGGIVADSVAEDEYQETLDKAKPFLQLVERWHEPAASES